MRTFTSALFLLIVAALVAAYVRGGPAGVAQWTRAKLVGT